ncbi:MAG: T9SS type A sorting domain-containing protein [Chitinispirillaceae bacterium]|nr:T9SS type A sorting domain-containing protein [Chitinispirillaceae bacterium]
MGGSSADDALKVSKEISVCDSSVGINGENRGTGYQGTSFKNNLAVASVSGRSRGISLNLKVNYFYNVAVYDLKGVLICQQKGDVKTAGNKLATVNLQFQGAGVYMVNVMVDDRCISGKVCVK